MASERQQRRYGLSLDNSENLNYMLNKVLDSSSCDLLVKDIMFVAQLETERLQKGSLDFMNENAKEWLVRVYVKCGK